MTKADRQRNYERRMKDRAQWTDSEWELLRMAYSVGYDEGFADGVVRGQNYQAQITDLIFNNAAGVSLP